MSQDQGHMIDDNPGRGGSAGARQEKGFATTSTAGTSGGATGARRAASDQDGQVVLEGSPPQLGKRRERHLTLFAQCRPFVDRHLRAAARAGMAEPCVFVLEATRSDARVLVRATMGSHRISFPGRSEAGENLGAIMLVAAGRREAAALLVPLGTEAARAVLSLSGPGCVVVSGGVTVIGVEADVPAPIVMAEGTTSGPRRVGPGRPRRSRPPRPTESNVPR